MKNIKFFPDPYPQQWLIGEFDRLRLSYGTRHWLPYRYYLFNSSCPVSGGPSGNSTGCRPRVWNRRFGHTSGQQGEEVWQNIIFFYTFTQFFHDSMILPSILVSLVYTRSVPYTGCWCLCHFSPSFFSFLVVRSVFVAILNSVEEGVERICWKTTKHLR